MNRSLTQSLSLNKGEGRVRVEVEMLEIQLYKKQIMDIIKTEYPCG